MERKQVSPSSSAAAAAPSPSSSAAESLEAILQIHRKLWENNILDEAKLNERLTKFFLQENSSFLILIGESHDFVVSDNTGRQIKIIDMINKLAPDGPNHIPIYHEMPSELQHEVGSPSIVYMMNLAFQRVYTYITKNYNSISDILQNNFVFSSVSVEDRKNIPGDKEYAADIQKICQDNAVTIGITGLLHTHKIKQFLNTNLDNGTTLRILAISSIPLKDLSNIMTKTHWDLLTQTMEYCLIFDLPNAKNLGERVMAEWMQKKQDSFNRQIAEIYPIRLSRYQSYNTREAKKKKEQMRHTMRLQHAKYKIQQDRLKQRLKMQKKAQKQQKKKTPRKYNQQGRFGGGKQSETFDLNYKKKNLKYKIKYIDIKNYKKYII